MLDLTPLATYYNFKSGVYFLERDENEEENTTAENMNLLIITLRM